MSDEHIDEYIVLPSPDTLNEILPASESILEHVHQSRKVIQAIMDGEDDRLLLVIGPCSIHDIDAAVEYAERLSTWAKAHEDRVFVVMRTYFEKPRTITGWKGMLYDPDRDASYNINKGMLALRYCLIQINDIGLPCACEFLDPNMPQYYADLISWGAIGARTTESQVHRQLASGLSCPIGFKNSTSGSVNYPINSIKSCAQPHVFPGIDRGGRAAVIKTTGNSYCHLVLRGSDSGPNYQHLDHIAKELVTAGLPPKIMIDCSHGNSGKCHDRQKVVWQEVIDQHHEALMGIMVESFLLGGNCPLAECSSDDNYGRSVTDKCISWDDTLALLDYTYMVLKKSTP